VEAAADRDLLASELSNAQIDAANARADAWRARYRTMPPVAAK
jgi:hypothetical protein